jgi:hypothetical protein
VGVLYAEAAVVDLRKVNDYLLSLTHPEGRSKARFFISHGFSSSEPERLVVALQRHACDGRVRLSRRNVFGNIHTVTGPLLTPDGRAPMVESVWIIEFGTELPRLITAYPS